MERQQEDRKKQGKPERQAWSTPKLEELSIAETLNGTNYGTDGKTSAS